jgi:uncharacterized protein (DUF1778 family)
MHRRKPKSKIKSTDIRIRVTEEQKARYAEAAERDGLDMSGWVRFLAERALATRQEVLVVTGRVSYKDAGPANPPRKG